MKRSVRVTISLAAAFGFTAVLSGALGAHALEDVLRERGMKGAWQTAAVYHLAHAISLLALGVWMAASGPSASRLWAAGLMCGGILLFSGSIYGLALGGPRFLGPVTPIGGILFMGAWMALMVSVWREEK